MKNYHGKDLASADWLTTHFRAKSAQRLRQITELPIMQGDKILDIGSGPGLFARYLLPLVGESGRLVCFDHDPVNIDLAERNLSISGMENWDVVVGDFAAATKMASQFDVLMLFNSACYLKNPEKYIISISEQMKPGSRIIVKDFDLSFMNFSGISAASWGTLIGLAREANSKCNPLPYDNFFGGKVHFLNRLHPFSKFENSIWTQHIDFPFSSSARRYIWENVRSLLDQACPMRNSELSLYFEEAFSLEGGWFFDDTKAIFIENEFLTSLTV